MVPALMFAATFLPAEEQALETPHAWLVSSMERVFPSSTQTEWKPARLDLARGERGSFQVAVRTAHQPATVVAEVKVEGQLETRVRRVGYVWVRHLNTDTPASDLDGISKIPGLAPDPLIEGPAEAGPFETHAFWVTVEAAPNIDPGVHKVVPTVSVGDSRFVLPAVEVHVSKAVAVKRSGFPVTHWFYADAIADWYKVEPFSVGFWPIWRKYVGNVVEHGQDVLYVPVFTPSLDGVKRPTQLLKVTRDGERYRFDWSLVQKWIDGAKAEGITTFEWSHLFTQWGCRYAIRIYEDPMSAERLLWPADTAGTSPTYRAFLEQFLPELKAFLDMNGLLELSLFHISDEPGGGADLESYKAARQMVREIAPWLKNMDAMSHIEFVEQKIIDQPIPSISVAKSFVTKGVPSWAYFCCGPRGTYLNRLIDTPLPKIRMTGFLLHALGAEGFLHWGYNYWYKSQTRQMIDPFTEQSGAAWPGWAYGDPFVVYPGPDGPIDSIRWEVFAEGLQDLALLRAAGIPPNDGLLNGIRDYNDFPKDREWVGQAKRRALDRLAVKQSKN